MTLTDLPLYQLCARNGRWLLVIILRLSLQQNRFCDASKRMGPLIGDSDLRIIYVTMFSCASHVLHTRRPTMEGARATILLYMVEGGSVLHHVKGGEVVPGELSARNMSEGNVRIAIDNILVEDLLT